MGEPQLSLALERADQPDTLALVGELDAYLAPLYPPESQHGLDPAALMKPGVLFAVARDARGMAIGIGAIVLHAEHGELKRMFVPARARGAGVGRALLAFLEREALRSGCDLLCLETGVLQPEAIRLYERAGFRRCPPFGHYREDPWSIFMQKPLRAGPA